jgi:type II secretory pathway component PulM
MPVKKTKKRKKAKKVKKEKTWPEMSYEERQSERSYQRWQQLNRKVERDNKILWGMGIFLLIYLFFQI